MQGLHGFIVKSEKEINETFKTEGGVELYGDARFSHGKMMNRIAIVQEVPLLLENSPIKKGFEIILDESVFLRLQSEHFGEIENNYTIDKRNGLYNVSTELIYAYRENSEANWNGFEQRVFVKEIIEEAAEIKVGSIILEPAKSNVKKGVFEIAISNDLLRENDFNEGDIVKVNEDFLLEVYIDNQKYFQLDNNDIFAKVIE